MSTTQTLTQTTTRTFAGDVVAVVMKISIEWTTLHNLAPHVGFYQFQQTLEEVTQLLMEGIVSEVYLKLHLAHEVIRVYRYRVGSGLQEWGPPATQVPSGYLPEGTSAKVTVTRNPSCPEAEFKAWLKKLGWGDTPCTLQDPAGSQYDTYGAFASGAFSMERAVLVNPKYAGTNHYAKKEAKS